MPTEAELSESVRLELSDKGGHVGFVNGSLFRPKRWLDARIVRHLREHFKP